MDVLISDNMKAETSQKVKDIFCMYCIEPCNSEPHHQHQNFAKRCMRHIQDVTNRVLAFTSAPAIYGC